MVIVRLDKIGKDTHIKSIVSATNLENGAVVKVGALRADGEAYDVTAPVAVDADELVFHASVPLMYEANMFEEDFQLKAGQAGRAYILRKGDIVTITDDGFSSATTVGQYAVPANGATKLAPAVTLGTEALGFKVIAKESLAGKAATVVEVVRA
jgi:hypothetical protein